jgi:hypothetical protein
LSGAGKAIAEEMEKDGEIRIAVIEMINATIT